MPVCITGMHRSGTSLVANLLRLCGLYLGEEADLLPASVDNAAGYWENRKLLLLNNDVLLAIGGAWDYPPPMPTLAWSSESRFQPLRLRAEELLRDFADREPWGWKDPRTSLTLPFWQDLDGIKMPFWLGRGSKLRIVLCLRDPFSVFESLRDRRHTPNSSGLDLWFSYNRSILATTLPEDRIITRYESYFCDPETELRRVLKFLEMEVSDEQIEGSLSVVSKELRHKNSTLTTQSEHARPEIANLYNAMCEEANEKN